MSFNDSIHERKIFFEKFKDLNFDPFRLECAENVNKLSEIALSLEDEIMGNIFFARRDARKKIFLNEHLSRKRRSLVLASFNSKNIMEIGFNAGHSALLLLTANPHVKLTCIDICDHKYTVPCYEFLKSIFGDRINLIKSTSVLAFPLLSSTNIDMDLYIIDGSHAVEIAEVDLYNVIQYGKKGSIICFDDTHNPVLRALVDVYLFSGKLIPLTDYSGFINNHDQMFFVNNK